MRYLKAQTLLLSVFIIAFGIGCGKKGTETKEPPKGTETDKPPVARFSASPTVGTPNLSVRFTDLSVGKISTHYWSFGDGSTSSASNPSHTYTTKGSFTVSLTVKGPGGGDYAVKNNFINIQCETPKASFSANKNSGQAPLTVNFTNNSSGIFSDYKWDFGDGQSSHVRNPSHTYTKPGEYSVKLTVSGNCGTNSYTRSGLITVAPRQSANFTKTWVEIDNFNDKLKFRSKLEIEGYRGRQLALGGYWFQKTGSSYYYVKSACFNNVPGGYMGRQWTIKPSYDNSVYQALGFDTPYSCFRNKTGSYFGMIKLYKSCCTSTPINGEELARTSYVEIYWSSTAPENSNDKLEALVRILNDYESKMLENEIRNSGGIQ